MKKLVLLPCPRAVLEHCGARAGLWTRKRKLHCPGQAEQRCHRGGGEHQVRAERDWRWRWRPAERQHGSGWPDQQRPSGRVIPRPGRRRSAGAIYGPRSGDHQHIDSTSAQPDLCPVPRCDDRKWRFSVAHRTRALTISTFATGASLGSTNSVPFRFWILAFDNASTVVLGLINCSAPTQIFPLDETGIQRSVAMTAGATSTGVFYTRTARRSHRRRIVSSVTSNTPVALQRLAPMRRRRPRFSCSAPVSRSRAPSCRPLTRAIPDRPRRPPTRKSRPERPRRSPRPAP
jgi:hypothetical protein